MALWNLRGATLGLEFRQLGWDSEVQDDWQELIRLAVREDLGACGDWTTLSLVPASATGQAVVAARQPGVLAGAAGLPAVLAALDSHLRWDAGLADGSPLERGAVVGRLSGPVRGMLAAERLLLNLLGRLSGVATLTRRYVDAISGTQAKIYDTRKTTPGWRRLEKYAVRCGGGRNHRSGLFEAVLIKDNHLAFGAEAGQAAYTPAQAVIRAREYLAAHRDRWPRAEMIVEVEVDTLDQLKAVLPAQPDIVLLDNMTAAQLREAVALRNAANPSVELEASGGVNLQTVRALAEAGVERISVGALTHSAVGLDLGLDWQAVTK